MRRSAVALCREVAYGILGRSAVIAFSRTRSLGYYTVDTIQGSRLWNTSSCDGRIGHLIRVSLPLPLSLSRRRLPTKSRRQQCLPAKSLDQELMVICTFERSIPEPSLWSALWAPLCVTLACSAQQGKILPGLHLISGFTFPPRRRVQHQAPRTPGLSDATLLAN